MKMKKLLVAAACLPLALMAQEDRYAQITNPRLTSINKEQPRSTFTSYTKEADAEMSIKEDYEKRILALNNKISMLEDTIRDLREIIELKTEVNSMLKKELSANNR